MSAVVPARRSAAVAWRDLVGGPLAEVTALVGLRDGVIVVAAANEAARREIVARAGALVGAFNLNAERLRAPAASALECFIADRFRPAVARAGCGPAPKPPVDTCASALEPRLLAQARARTAALAPRVRPAGREALARIAARIAAREGRQGGWDETGSRAGGNRGGPGKRTRTRGGS